MPAKKKQLHNSYIRPVLIIYFRVLQACRCGLLQIQKTQILNDIRSFYTWRKAGLELWHFLDIFGVHSSAPWSSVMFNKRLMKIEQGIEIQQNLQSVCVCVCV